MSVGARVLELRLQRAMSQVRLAETAGLSRTFVRRVEKDAVSPSVRSLDRLAAALGVSANALLGGHHGSDDSGSPAARQASGRGPVSGHLRSVRVVHDAGAGTADGYAHDYLMEGDYDGTFTVILAEDDASSGMRSTWHLHPGEFGVGTCMVLEGTYEATIGTEVRVLGPGEQIEFTADVRHTWRHVGSTPGRTIIARVRLPGVVSIQECPTGVLPARVPAGDVHA